jgi:hypothetical protein
MSKNRRWIVVAVIAVVVMVLAGVALTVLPRASNKQQRIELRDGVRPETPAAAATRQATRVYSVGVIVSHASANGIWHGDQRFGYSYEHAVRELRDPHVRIVPLLEPGTADDPEIAKALAATFKSSPPLEVTDAAALKNLDVIVASRSLIMLPAALDAIESAVSDGGVGLLLWGNLGDHTPGFDDARVGRLTGLGDAQWGSTADKAGAECTVLAAHPILGKLKPGAKLKLQASGAYGPLPPYATALVSITDQSQVRPYNTTTRPTRTDLTFHPIYLSRLGKGKIVGCSFPAFRQFPPSLNRAVGGDFLLRCVGWLAEKEPAAPTTTAKPN